LAREVAQLIRYLVFLRNDSEDFVPESAHHLSVGGCLPWAAAVDGELRWATDKTEAMRCDPQPKFEVLRAIQADPESADLSERWPPNRRARKYEIAESKQSAKKRSRLIWHRGWLPRAHR
jgi:hypothetical protein